METQTETNPAKQAPMVPFAPEFPPEAVFARAARDLKVGQSVAFPLTLAHQRIMERYAKTYSSKQRELALTTESDRYVLTKISEGDAARGKSISTRLSELAIGGSVTIEGPRVGTVRSVATTLFRNDKPMRFMVTETGRDTCLVTRVELDGKRQQAWARYQFGSTEVGGQFTVPDGGHGGIESMRSACNYHSRSRGLVFKARENTDGSITVRCYADGGLPPKWVMDRDHARLQEEIQKRKAK